jgi:hypothetical protein
MSEPGDNPKRQWLDLLEDEDRTFIKRFVLASGSLKRMAGEYGISYPTVRLRLDRLIQKIKLAEDHSIESDFELALRAKFADGNIDMPTLKNLLTAFRQEMEQRS